jgi:hypothetical protein
MEIPYRNTKLLLKIIPKDTLLFRMVQNPIDDMRGVSIGDGKRCLTPNYNVFFYPNPFAGPIAFAKYPTHKNLDMVIYKLTTDIKVISLVKPSKYTRYTKNQPRTFIKRCSTVKKGCLPRSGTSYDPCLSDTIIKKYPDVVGILAISVSDTASIKRRLKKTKRFFKFAEDARNIPGIPELILHPLKQRPQKDLITVDSDPLEQNYEQIGKYSQNDPALEKFMNKHATYDSDTFFYKFRN